MTDQWFRETWNAIRQDSSLKDTISVNDILAHAQDHEYTSSPAQIEQDIRDAISSLADIPLRETCLKLRGYRLVDEIRHLQKGKHIRWIRIDKYPHDLAHGGMLTDIKFTDRGTMLQFKVYGGRFLQHPFDQCILFQKMSADEEIALHLIHASFDA
jgi:hypothetical protein